jgi:hypothetical protein
MPEQHDAPTSGETQNTPAADAPTDASGQGTPTSTPIPISELRDKVFKDGYGKGADKGRKEGELKTLKLLGLPLDIDEAHAYLGSVATQQKTEAEQQIDIRETNEYRSLASEHQKAAKRLEQYEKQLEVFQRQADEARLEKLRNAALRHGVGDGQVEALVALYGNQVRLSEDGALEVLSKMPDGSLAAAGKPVNDWLDEATKANPWLLAPKQSTGGAGSSLGSTKSSAPRKVEGDAYYDPRPFSERMRGK